jgi:hypothetical protein
MNQGRQTTDLFCHSEQSEERNKDGRLKAAVVIFGSVLDYRMRPLTVTSIGASMM